MFCDNVSPPQMLRYYIGYARRRARCSGEYSVFSLVCVQLPELAFWASSLRYKFFSAPPPRLCRVSVVNEWKQFAVAINLSSSESLVAMRFIYIFVVLFHFILTNTGYHLDRLFFTIFSSFDGSEGKLWLNLDQIVENKGNLKKRKSKKLCCNAGTEFKICADLDRLTKLYSLYH